MGMAVSLRSKSWSFWILNRFEVDIGWFFLDFFSLEERVVI